MPASRSPQQTASLFPFLAVLVCAMGALILLLLVTTRRIRQNAEHRAQIAAVDDAPLPLPLEPVMPETTIVGYPDDDALWTSTLAPAEIPAPLPVPGPTAEELRREWERTVADLEARHADLSAQLDRFRRTNDQQAIASRAVESQRGDLVKRQESISRQLATLTADAQRRAQDAQALVRERARLEEEIARARTDSQQATGKYEILPYDGRLGTTRRPIVIECRESEIAFVSEGVSISATQLSGFTESRNPLLEGTKALINYWLAQNRRNAGDEAAGRPYVLLVVRPGGTVGYYVARKLLEDLGQEFGYELVTEDQEFRWPETDDAARDLCRRAVNEVLDERDRLLARTTSQTLPLAGPLTYADKQGRFHLEEVTRLRGGADQVTVGGRQWQRTQTTEPTRRVVEFPQRGDPGGDEAPRTLVPDRTARPLGDEGALYDTQVDGGSATGAPQLIRPPTRPEASRTSAEIDPDNPQWGAREVGSTIGLEREVLIRVGSGRASVADATLLAIPDGISTESMQRDLAKAINKQVHSWGMPPRSFYWVPLLKFEVASGGDATYQRLARVTQQWGLRSTVDKLSEQEDRR